MTRCISCGRLPSEDHCDICHRAARAASSDSWPVVVRAVAQLSDAIGYENLARAMRELAGDEVSELFEGFGDPGGEVREVNLGGVPG